jgi:PAS domain S-box-containing protein
MSNPNKNDQKLLEEIACLRQQVANLEANQERNQRFSEAAFEGIILHNDGSILDVNHAAQEIFGYSRKELLEKRVINLIATEFQGIVGDRLHAESEKPFEVMGQRKDGTNLYLEIICRTITERGLQVGVVNIRDVIDRKQIEMELENSFIQLADLNKELADVMFALDQHSIVSITDKQGRITKVNDRFVAISGYKREELLGHSHRKVDSSYHSQDFFQEMWQKISTGNVWQGEIKNKTKHGGIYWVNTTIVPFLNDQGKPYQYVAVGTDITEQKKINEMKNEFVSVVSHELRTPLATILGFMEIMLKRNLTIEKMKKYTETVYQEGNRLSNLINDFLDLQRMESGRQEYCFTPVPVNHLVQDLWNYWDGRQNHHLTVNLPSKENYIRGDADRLRQVLHNLISNAIKYSPNAENVDLTVYVEHDRVIIQIQDYGLGIPEEAKDKLFSKFYRVDNSDRRKIGGTGLGLAIVKEIIEAHQGTISFSSKLGVGSLFMLELPQYSIPSLNGKIVILEDDQNLSRLIGDTLENLQLPVVYYTCAEAAMLALEQSNGSPLLCIVDIQLEGVNSGWDFISCLYRHPFHNQTPIIVSTVLEPPQHYREKEMEKFLQKPFNIDRLNEMVQQMLQLKYEKVSYIFPYQDENTVAFSLQENGIEIKEIKIDQDTIQVEVKKHV